MGGRRPGGPSRFGSRAMSFGRPVCRGILPACGAAALLVLLGAAPAARAACGDYVTVVRPGESPAHDPGEPRCHGPNCSVPPAQAGPVGPPRLMERPSVDLAAEPPTSDQDRSTRAAHRADESPTPTPLTADIFHPPRAR
jgi:hypothetical protein